MKILPLIYKLIKCRARTVCKAVILAVMAICVNSCVDDLDYPVGYCPEGERATVTVSLDIDEMPNLTRGEMQAGLDRSVTDLWIAVYNASTGARTGEFQFSRNDNNPEHTPTEITIDALSGKSYIVGVANFRNRSAASADEGDYSPLADMLSDADTWEKYKAISVSFNSDGEASIETPLNALLMSGTFLSGNHPDGSRRDDETVDIYPGVSKPSGMLHLRRLISQVKFNISYNKQNIRDFDVVSWRVVNVPNQTWLRERADGDAAENACDVRRNGGAPYMSTGAMSDITHNGDVVSFDYWQLENKRKGRTPTETTDIPYHYREKQYKDEAGMNTGKFSALVDSKDSDDPANNATYVEFDVTMHMLVDENGNKLSDTSLAMRSVETRYYVHLGYFEGGADKLTDFNCRRNSKYTYNVTINNVSDVLVEAKREGDGERNPGVEGIVSDVLKGNYTVDAHYSAINVYFTDDEIRNFEYLVLAYDLTGREMTINSRDFATVPADRMRYMQWVELRPADGEKALASYKPRSGSKADGKTYLLSDFKEKGARGELKAGWYTMFIDEYVYETATDGNESASGNWPGYVNRPDRKAWLYVRTEISDDRNSMYYQSKYAVSQKSIQTYYNSLPASGLGVEHVNESFGLNLRNSYNPEGNGNHVSGRYNLAYRLAGNSSWDPNKSLAWRDNSYRWSTFLSVNEFQSINAINNVQGVSRQARAEFLPKIRTVSGSYSQYDPDHSSNCQNIEAITACLNRNRDLDGDGYIDASEIRWFVPVKDQYVRVILGRRSLVTPVLDVESTSRLPYTNNNDNNSSMFFYTSDGRQIWAMEGTSDSNWQAYNSAAPWEVRCVRNLGGNMSVINTTNITQPAYVLRSGTRIIDMKYYDSKSVRTEPYYTSDHPMPVHHIYDQRYNRCYKSFEVAEAKYDLGPSDLEDFNVNSYDWAVYLSTHNPCKKLVSLTGKDGWRVPNQKEITIMCSLGLHPPHYYGFSCSVSYYDKEGYGYGKNPNDLPGSLDVAHRYVMKSTTYGTATQGGDGDTRFGIRCVRDNVE